MRGELELMEIERDNHRERLAQVTEVKRKRCGELTSVIKELWYLGGKVVGNVRLLKLIQ